MSDKTLRRVARVALASCVLTVTAFLKNVVDPDEVSWLIVFLIAIALNLVMVVASTIADARKARVEVRNGLAEMYAGGIAFSRCPTHASTARDVVDKLGRQCPICHPNEADQ